MDVGQKLQAYLAGHWLSVDLAHVESAVVSLDNVNAKSPGIVSIMTDTHPWIICHHMGVYGKDCLGIRPQPSHLSKQLVVRLIPGKCKQTLCPPKCLTTQVNWADRPAATVIFSRGETNPGSNPVTGQKKRKQR